MPLPWNRYRKYPDGHAPWQVEDDESLRYHLFYHHNPRNGGAARALRSWKTQVGASLWTLTRARRSRNEPQCHEMP